MRNGRVHGWGLNGIDLQNQATVRNVLVSENGGDGLALGGDAMVVGCTAYWNQGNGIFVSSGIVRDSLAVSNVLNGIC